VPAMIGPLIADTGIGVSAVDEGSFLTMVAMAALAAFIVAVAGPRVAVPVVVVEIVLGIIAGPELLGLADPDEFTQFFSNLGLGMLFFFAGYEIDFERIRGVPLRLGAIGWLLSLALAFGLGGLLAAAGVVLSLRFTGAATATTAIGTLIPILSDAGELRTRFGRYLLAAGAVGEFGPILLITLWLSTTHPFGTALILLAFIALAVVSAVLAVRSVSLGWSLFEGTLETSAQLAIRLAVVLVFALVALAAKLGLDLLIGGFVAGIITRLAVRDREVRRFESKLIAVGYGFFIPFFFVFSGVTFNLDAVVGSASGMLKVPLFVAMFLVVRGLPALLLYRRVLDLRDRMALAVLSATQLPLVVAITTVAVEQGHMRSSTGAALVGAAIVSTLAFPLLGLRLRAGRAHAEPEPAAAAA
jgi:Kef-type K+ transport system membrane component KefB